MKNSLIFHKYCMSSWTDNKKDQREKPIYDPSLHRFHKGEIDGDPGGGYPRNYFYADTIRALIVGFGNFFNDICVLRYNEKGEPIKKIQIPIKYGPRMKSHDFRVEQETGKKYYIQLPNITYRIDGYQFAGDRYAGAGEVRGFYSKCFELNGIDYVMANKFWEDVQPVPYNITITMEAKTEHISDLNQIIEQIIVRFAPENYMDLKEFWFMNKRRSIKIRMDSVNQEINTDFGEEDKRESMASFTFTLEAFIYKPIRNSNIIDQIVTHLGVRNTDETYNQKILGNYSYHNPFTDRYDLSLEFGTKIGRVSALSDTFETTNDYNYSKTYSYEELDDITNYPVGSKQILSYSAFADEDKTLWNGIHQQLTALSSYATVTVPDDTLPTKAQFWSVSGNSATFDADNKQLNIEAITASGSSAESARDTIWEIGYDPSYVIIPGKMNKDGSVAVSGHFGGMIVKQYKNLFGFGDWNSDISKITGTKDILLGNEYIQGAPYVASSKVEKSGQVS